MNTSLNIAVKACFEVGLEIMDVYNNEMDVSYKDDRSPLTQADTKANEIINKYLRITGIPIISEENAEIDYETRKDWNQCWVVDPLDGTKEFIKRNGEFTVNTALVENQEPKLGAVYAPALEKLYFADVTTGECYMIQTNSNKGIEELLETAVRIKSSRVEDVVRVVTSSSHIDNTTFEFVESLKSQKKIELISQGSSLKFCLLAEGKADIYPRFAPTMEWDTAAAHALCRSLGISVQSHPSGQELVYNKKDLKNPWFLCKHKEIVI